jgi:(p)ppGpp synthase/HD superfamily hydrolase
LPTQREELQIGEAEGCRRYLSDAAAQPAEVRMTTQRSSDGKGWDFSRVDRALLYASQLHAKQKRKGGNIPYLGHLLGVASIVLDYGGNEDEAIAALLHDAVEDQGGNATRQEIRRRFGDKVTEIVDGCADADQVPKPPWGSRKRAYIARIRDQSSSVLLVSAADKLHNARAILADYRVMGDSLWDRFTGGKDGTLWYYRQLVKAYREAGAPGALTEELERVVSELERLAIPELRTVG